MWSGLRRRPPVFSGCRLGFSMKEIAFDLVTFLCSPKLLPCPFCSLSQKENYSAPTLSVSTRGFPNSLAQQDLDLQNSPCLSPPCSFIPPTPVQLRSVTTSPPYLPEPPSCPPQGPLLNSHLTFGFSLTCHVYPKPPVSLLYVWVAGSCCLSGLLLHRHLQRLKPFNSTVRQFS